MSAVDDVLLKLDGNAEDYGYTRDVIGQKLTTLPPAAIARDYWEAVAARAATLVDTSESGSTRNLSQLRTNALAQARYWSDQIPAPTSATTRRTRVNKVERA